MKPNVQLNHIISLTMDLGEAGKTASISVGGNSRTVTVFLDAEQKKAKLDDRDGLNKIADWLSLAAGSDVAEAVGDIAEAKADAAKAVKRQVDKLRFNRVLVDVTAPGVISS